jgi:hypothetical protein
VLRIRVTPEERRALDVAAKRAGVGPCSFARVAVMAALQLQPTPPPTRRRQPTEAARSLSKFLGELGRIASNLNQCARHANSGLGVDHTIIEEVKSELCRLREAIIATGKSDGSSS